MVGSVEFVDARKWIVEKYTGGEVTVDVADSKHSVCVFSCRDTGIRINGKSNSILIDGCRHTSILIDSVVSQVEVINCQRVNIQVTGTMPTISVQKTEGCQVYLSRDSLNADILTSMVSTMNVLIPKPDDDFEEIPVPELLKTNYKDGRLVTVPADMR